MTGLLSLTRPVGYVPKVIQVLLVSTLLIQLSWHYSSMKLITKETRLYDPPTIVSLRMAGLDDTITTAKVTMLWLQAFDNQPGISLPLKDLDYAQVIKWLNMILELDSLIQYPLLAAIRFYAEVTVPEKQRQMVEFVSRKFLEKPHLRWPAMAHAVYIAKHRIKDKQLAVNTARLLRRHATGSEVPYWAKQMEFFVLEDMGELEAAKILIGGLLESGELEDEHQQRFLSARLKEIEKRQQTNSLSPDATQ